jgi:hypothetical protein
MRIAFLKQIIEQVNSVIPKACNYRMTRFVAKYQHPFLFFLPSYKNLFDFIDSMNNPDEIYTLWEMIKLLYLINRRELTNLTGLYTQNRRVVLLHRYDPCVIIKS